MPNLPQLAAIAALSAAMFSTDAVAKSFAGKKLNESTAVAPGAAVGFNPQPEPPARRLFWN